MINRINKKLEIIENILFGAFCIWLAIIAYKLNSDQDFINSFSSDSFLRPLWDFLRDINAVSSWLIVFLTTFYGLLKFAQGILKYKIEKSK